MIKIRKRKTVRIVLLILTVYILLVTVPYIEHKAVTKEHKAMLDSYSYYGDKDGTERVRLITDNSDALEYRIRMIDAATHRITLSTFDFNSDESGKYIMSALLKAADRGVDVRIIIDGMNSTMDVYGNKYFECLAANKHIQIKIYNPVEIIKPWNIQARLHDKYLITDDKMYLLGGRNTTNLFLGHFKGGKNIDRELFVYEQKNAEASSINSLINYSEKIWNMADSKVFSSDDSLMELKDVINELNRISVSASKQYSGELDFQSNTVKTRKITLLTNPVNSGNKEPLMLYSLNTLMKKGKKVTIYTPYIICGKEMYDMLDSLCKEGREVNIITNDVSSGANPWGCTDYMNQKDKIAATGVNVFEYNGYHSSHTKCIVVDDRMSIIGSYNLDMRSTYQDTELMLAVDSTELCKTIQKGINEDMKFCRYIDSSGKYIYGNEYRHKNQSQLKKCVYSILRVITVPIRRFL